MPSTHASIAQRVSLLPLETSAFLLALLEREQAIEKLKEIAESALGEGRKRVDWLRERLKDRGDGGDPPAEQEPDKVELPSLEEDGGAEAPETDEEKLREEQEQFDAHIA